VRLTLLQPATENLKEGETKQRTRPRNKKDEKIESNQSKPKT
jgi:hypothetical protein